MELLARAHAMSTALVRLRHAIHREPEIGLTLPGTQHKVKSALRSLPVEIIEGRSLNSITAVLHGAQPGPVVLLRADMDALPISEEVATKYRSRNPGVMHACGHDLHTAMLVGAAHLVAQHRAELAGTVVFMFQPGEEGWNGAQRMIEEGVLTAGGKLPDAAYALHVASAQPHGVFATKPGLMFASSDRLRVTVRGPGGHAADSRRLHDPVLAASKMVQALYAPPLEKPDPAEHVVFLVGSFHAGVQPTIQPTTAEFEATLRSYSPTARARIITWVHSICQAIAAEQDLTVDVRWKAEYPVTKNAGPETALAVDVVSEVFGSKRYAEMSAPLAAAEDFSQVLEIVPGAMITLGAAPSGLDMKTAPFNHSPYAVFDDGVLADGAAMYAALALAQLSAESTEQVGLPTQRISGESHDHRERSSRRLFGLETGKSSTK